jgi:signal transduction histidine kinase
MGVDPLNQVVILLSAPLLVVFVLLALRVRRYGATHWIFAIVASWLAGFVEIVGSGYQPPAVALGVLSSVLFATGAIAYSGRELGMRAWTLLLSIPIVAGITTALAGTGRGYAFMAANDVVLMASAAWSTRPRGSSSVLPTARVLPWSFVAYLPPDLYYQISRSLGHDPSWPTVVVAMGLTSLAAVLLLALTGRVVQHETLVREGLEARLVEQEGALEQTLARVRSAERLATVGTLAAGIAHQINNPVGAILAAAQFELSAAEEGKGLDAGARATLAAIEREALRCARIVRSVLQFARTDPGEVGEHDLNEIVESALAATEAYARRRDAAIDLKLDGKRLAVRGNAVELEQVFVNLIRNAIESRANGARVQVRVDATPEGSVVLVRDNGPGLSDEARRRLFEPFFTTKLHEGGSGLGLSVVHGILMTHGGDVEVVPTSPAGTCFRVTLPGTVPVA